jgi:hypothetical protein
MSNFMEPQITRRQNWLRVETTEGTEWVNVAETSLFVRNSETVTHPMTEQERTETVNKIRPFVNGEPQDWEKVTGFGARLSAPGYLDCTEWAVFDSEDEAREHLAEISEDDEPEQD